MKAAVFRGNGILEVCEVEEPMIRKATEVKLKVIAAGICGSDLHALSVPPGLVIPKDIILGHEFFGEIVDIGTEVQGVSIGEKVAVHPSIACGHCYECTHGLPHLCSNQRQYGQTMDGGFAQYVVVENSQIYPLPENVNPDCAAQTEPIACIMDSLKKIDFTYVDHVVIFGAGPIGLSFIRVLKHMGIPNLIVTAKGAVRVEEAKNSGADLVVDVEKENLKTVMEREWMQKANLIIDAVGSGDALSEGMELMECGGQILVFGYNALAKTEIKPSLISGKEYKIIGALGKDFESALKIVKDSSVGMEKLVTRRITLDEIVDAVKDLRAKKECRVIVYPNGRSL